MEMTQVIEMQDQATSAKNQALDKIRNQNHS